MRRGAISKRSHKGLVEGEMDLTKFKDGITKTGFKLEFDISSILAAHGWTVINNKYYLDDQQASVREIDLVAYKVQRVQHFHVYTTLIISCKKNEKDVWVLLAKERDRKDPNINWLPIHAWSNDKAITYILNGQAWRDGYLSHMKDAGCISIADVPKKHIFAFQEMDKVKGSPNNDKNIFNSIVSLMKAQAYEMNAFSHRKKEPAVYQINLISVMDTDLVRLDFSKGTIDSCLVDDEVYVAGYIIDKHQTFSKIHFINASTFNVKLAEYDKIHKSNIICFDSICNDFYTDAIKVSEKRDMFIEQVKKDLRLPIQLKIWETFNKVFYLESLGLFWDDDVETLQVMLDLKEREVEALNEDDILRGRLATTLKEHYRYAGLCRFDVNIPF